MEKSNKENSNLSSYSNIYRAVLEKAVQEPLYFNTDKPLNKTKFTPRDKKGLGLQLRMSV